MIIRLNFNPKNNTVDNGFYASSILGRYEIYYGSDQWFVSNSRFGFISMGILLHSRKAAEDFAQNHFEKTILSAFVD